MKFSWLFLLFAFVILQLQFETTTALRSKSRQRMMEEEEDEEDDNQLSVPTGKLSNGIEIPLVGLGCASGVAKAQVLSALKVGYRFLDTAQAYQWGYNEQSVAEAIAESPHVKRRDVWVTTKIHPENLGYEATKRAVQTSLDLPGFEGYLDAILIHKPRCWQGACSKVPEGTWQDSWRALEELYEAGKTRAIGICDVNDDEMLNELLGQKIRPHIIQNWFDPFHQEPRMLYRIQSSGILYQGYSTLGAQWNHFHGLAENPVHTSPLLLEIANQHSDSRTHVSPAQVVIQWAVKNKGISVVPASRNKQRQASNLWSSFAFQLTQDQLNAIDQLDGNAPKPTQPNPNEVDVTFVNPKDTSGIQIYWINPDSQEEVDLGLINVGETKRMNTFHGHSFRFRYADSSQEEISTMTIDRANGKQQQIIIEEESDEL